MIEALPASAVKKANYLIRDARQAVIVGLIPVLCLAFTLRLAQWYGLRRQFPEIAAARSGEEATLANEFRSALPRLWFAVLFWPVLILFVFGYSAIR